LHWESRLADTRTPVGVNRGGVRPLAEVNYPGWHLPITLYVPTLHEIEAVCFFPCRRRNSGRER
jgi:hypothetical protein